MSCKPQLFPRAARTFFALAGLALGLFQLHAVSAQHASHSPKVVGQYLYDRLLKTQQEYEAALAEGDSLEVAELCYQLGKRYNGLGDFESAQKYFIRSLHIREPLGPSEAIGKVYLFMSHYQMEQKNYRGALQTLRKAMFNFNAANSPHGRMSGNLAIAGAYALVFDAGLNASGTQPSRALDSALFFYWQAETMALQLKKSSDLANVYLGEGQFLLKTNVQRGLAYLKKADALFTAENLPYPIINTSLIIGDAYLTVRQPIEAATWLARAQRLIDSSRHGDYQQQSKLLQAYTRFYEQTGDWQRALGTQRRYHDLTVEALGADRAGAITRLSMEYESEKKEVMLARQRKLIALALGLCVITLIASVVFYRFFQRYKHLSKQNAALVKEQNHRVKNNFQEVINLLTLQANRLTNQEARQAVTEGLLRMEAMALVHQRLYADTDRLVEIDLAEFVPELVEVVLRAYGYDHVRPAYQLDSIWLHVDQAVPLGLIVNELVTNACKYAFSTHPDPALAVSCQQSDDTVTLEVSDNGPGYNPPKNGKTFGLKLIKALSQRLNGHIHLGDKGASFRLSFPSHTPALSSIQ